LPESPRRPRATRAHPAGRQRRAGEPQAGTPGFVAVGRVGAPWSVRGDVKVQPLTDFPERFQPGAALWVGGERREVRRSRWNRGLVYICLAGVEGRDAAEELRGALLEVPEADLMPLPEGQYYQFQVIGLEVQTPQGAVLGRVAEILSTPSNDVYVVRGGPRELLLPAIEDVVKEVDLEAGRLVVEPLQEL
jgi:16S rRNA processing protein RimM